MGRAADDMRDVELVEADPMPAPGESGTPGTEAPDHPPRPDRQPRVHAPRVVATVVAVAVLLGAGWLWRAQRESARLDALADVPGILRPLDGPLVERWRSDVPLWVDLHAVDGLLIGVTEPRGGTRDADVVAVDAATGRTVWAAPAVRTPRAPLHAVRCVVPSAAPGARERDRLVACLVVDELGPSARDLSEYEPTASRLLVLRAGTGDVLADRPVDPSTSVAAIGGDLVVAERAPDGAVRVARTDALGTEERWRFTGPPGDPRREYVSVRVDGDLVVVPGEEGWVLSATGDVVEAWSGERPAPSDWAGVLGGRVLVRPLRDVAGATAITDLRTGTGFTVDGFPAVGATDDGSARDLVLVRSTRDDRLEAYTLSGERRWRADGSDSGGLVVMDGRVVRVVSQRMEAVDADTGRVLWQTPVPAASQYGLRTDGRVVVRAERVGDDLVVAARGLDDGRVRWRADLPEDVQHLFVVGGQLVGYTSDGLVALRSTED